MENQEVEKKMMSIVADDGSLNLKIIKENMLYIQKMRKMRMIM